MLTESTNQWEAARCRHEPDLPRLDFVPSREESRFAFPGSFFRGLTGQDGLVGEDAIEGGTADLELAGGAELVAAVELKDELDVVTDDGVEREVFRIDGGLGNLRRGSFLAAGQVKVFGADDAIDGFEESGFKDRGQFADVAGPGVLEEAGERAGAEQDRALLIAGAETVEETLSERGDVFAAQAQGGTGQRTALRR